MKNLRIGLVALAAIAFCALPTLAGSAAHPGWEKMKLLVGEWEGKYNDASPVRVSYKLVSNGTSLMESLQAPGETDMVTVYHLDGERLMMTHYCAANNQPRMRADSAQGEARQLTFSFLDATNLASPDAEHMRKLVVTFQDPDHFKQEWTSRSKGKEDTGVFQYTRKK